MEGLLNYSAIAAKLSAMRGRFLTADQYRELAFTGTVPAAVEYLKTLPSYNKVFTETENEDLHRGRIEQLLWLSLYQDYSSLYRFSNLNQRKFLDFYFLHFEIDILKKCLRNALASRKSQLDFNMFETFFQRHSRLNLESLQDASTLSSFIESLRGSFYYQPLSRLQDEGVTSLFEYESSLDTLYFIHMWKTLKRHMGKAEKEAVFSSIGEKLDLLNLEWIARAKQHYQLSADGIRGFLIPVNYRLKKEQIDAMAAAASFEEFLGLLPNTAYGNRIPPEIFSGRQISDIKTVFRSLLDAVYQSAGRKKPYSAATLNSFFYFKEKEIQNIITAVEGIRYQLDGNEIMSCLTGSSKGGMTS